MNNNTSLGYYKSAFRDVALKQIQNHKQIDQIGFEFGLMLLGIDVPIDRISESGCLDEIQDDHQRDLMKKTWEAMQQWNREMSDVLNAIDDMCR